LRDVAYGRGRDDEESKFHKTLSMILELVTLNLGNIYFVSPIAQAAFSTFKKGQYGYPVSDPLASTMTDFAKGAGNTFRAIEELAEQERYVSGEKRGQLKAKGTILKAIDQAAGAVAMLSGIPYRTAKGLVYRAPKHLIERVRGEKAITRGEGELKRRHKRLRGLRIRYEELKKTDQPKAVEFRRKNMAALQATQPVKMSSIDKNNKVIRNKDGSPKMTTSSSLAREELRLRNIRAKLKAAQDKGDQRQVILQRDKLEQAIKGLR